MSSPRPLAPSAWFFCTEKAARNLKKKKEKKSNLSFLNIWDTGKQILNSGYKTKENKTLFVCFFHKRIWCSTGYEFRASPREESYAYEVIPNYSVWLTIQQLWKHSTGSFNYTETLDTNPCWECFTWNYYSKFESCLREKKEVPDFFSSGAHL